MLTSKPSIIASAVLLSLGLAGCGSDSKEANVAPTAITLAANSIAENSIATDIGALTVTDSNANDSHTLTVSDERFEIVEGMLKLKANVSLDFEQEAEVTLNITATDQDGLAFEKELTVTVTDTVDTYTFASKLLDGESSVSYGGQIARQILIIQLSDYISSGLQADYDAGLFSSKADVVAKLMAMYAGDKTTWEESKADQALNFSTTPATKQASLGDISSSHKNLQAKIAGQDEGGQHKDWSTEFEGWNTKGSVSPDGLIQEFFSLLGDNVQAALDGNSRFDINGETITKFYLQDNGLDLKQLTQKFLLGAVNFSQGSDDYLDNTIEGKGLNSANITGDKDGTKPYTTLEHIFDEGFGYFGAARDYNDYTDLEIRAKSGRDGWNKGYHDTNADDQIDLKSEYNFGHSTNAAKRDAGSAANTNPTDFTKEAFDAFLAARTVISNAVGAAFTTEQAETLLAERDKAVLAWEKAISATVVHYINEVINDDLATIGTENFNYANLAKHWSELKGFSLGLQFNPRSPVTDEKFTQLQELIGMQPALVEADVAGYQDKLLQARDILETAYGFDAENVEKW